MYSTAELIKARLTFVRKELEEVIDHLEPRAMNWAPAPGMRTIAGQLLEIAGCELQLITVLKEDRWVPDEEIKALLSDPSDLECLNAFLESTRQGTLAYVDGLSQEDLDIEVELKGWHESIGLPLVPRGEALRGIPQHEYYHLGQLVSYLWARGDNPYKWSR